MDNIICPDCGHEHSISKMELWNVYEGDGAETELDCGGCDKPLIITSQVVEWSFEVEINE
jgi:hypothetical protein